MGFGAKHTTMTGDGATLLAEYNEVDPQYEGVSYWGPEPVPFDKFSVLRLYNYGGVESRYPLIWYGQSVGRPSTTFTPMPAGETDVVVMSPYPNNQPAIYDAPLSVWYEGLHEVDVWCCANPASFSSIKFGLYDGPHEWCRDGTLRAEWTVPAEDGVWKRTRLRWLNEVGPVEGYLRMTCVYAVSWQTFAFGYKEVLPYGTEISYNPPASAVRSVHSYVDQFPVQAASCQTWMRAPLLRWTRNDDVTVEYVLSDSTGDLVDLTGCGVTWSAETYGGDNLTVLTLGSGITLSPTNFGTISIVVPADSAMMSHDDLYHCDLQVETPYGQTTTIDKFRVKVEKDVPFEPGA